MIETRSEPRPSTSLTVTPALAKPSGPMSFGAAATSTGKGNSTASITGRKEKTQEGDQKEEATNILEDWKIYGINHEEIKKKDAS